MTDSDRPRCDVRDCAEAATRGEMWDGDQWGPIEAYRKGIQLRLTVLDLAVMLKLCDTHAKTLVDAAWTPALTLLGEWGWRPTGPRKR